MNNNEPEKKKKTKSLWFPFSKNKKKCTTVFRTWLVDIEVEVSKPRKFEVIDHVYVDPNSDIGIASGFVIMW